MPCDALLQTVIACLLSTQDSSQGAIDSYRKGIHTTAIVINDMSWRPIRRATGKFLCADLGLGSANQSLFSCLLSLSK